MVHQIDLSYALLHGRLWLEEGEGLRRKFGDRWVSLLPSGRRRDILVQRPETPIAQMIASLGLTGGLTQTRSGSPLDDRARGVRRWSLGRRGVHDSDGGRGSRRAAAHGSREARPPRLGLGIAAP